MVLLVKACWSLFSDSHLEKTGFKVRLCKNTTSLPRLPVFSALLAAQSFPTSSEILVVV